jgi:hypothetical protein
MGTIKIGEVRRMVHLALRNFHNPSISKNEDRWFDLLLIREENPYKDKLRVAISSLIVNLINSQQNSTSFKILKTRFIDQNTILETARAFNLSEDQTNRLQRQGISELAQLLILKEKSKKNIYQRTLNSKIPISTTKYFIGRDAILKELIGLFEQTNFKFKILMIGIGGIGKTSLIIEFAQNLIAREALEDIIWINAGKWQNEFENNFIELIEQTVNTHIDLDQPGVRESSLPLAIIIDEVDRAEHLRILLNSDIVRSRSTNVLISSRSRPTAIPNTISSFYIEEFERTDSFEILKSKLVEYNLDYRIDECKDHFPEIYQYIGGNPLAIAVFSGMLEVIPVKPILNDFREANFRSIEEMYRHIFSRSWESLSHFSQELLITFSAINAPDTAISLNHLASVSKLGKVEMFQGLEQLYLRSMIERRGKDQYSIHALTRSFLQTKLIK